MLYDVAATYPAPTFAVAATATFIAAFIAAILLLLLLPLASAAFKRMLFIYFFLR